MRKGVMRPGHVQLRVLDLEETVEHYRDRLRGFYFDYEDWAPGPVSANTDELVEHLRELLGPDGSRRWDDSSERFRRRFCSLEDGHATDRVIDAFFDPALG